MIISRNELKVADFRLYDPRPLGNKISGAEQLRLQIGYKEVDVINLYAEIRELVDAKRVFPVFYNDQFVGVLDPGRNIRGLLLENNRQSGYTVSVECVGTRYANTIEPKYEVVAINESLFWIQPEEAQVGAIDYLNELHELEMQQAGEQMERIKNSIFGKLFGRKKK